MRIASGKVRTMLTGAAFGALVFASPSHAQELKELNILLPNNNTTGLYPVIVARELGLFEKQGIKVNWLDSETTVPYVAFLSNGQADAVMLDAPQTFQAVNSKLTISVVYEAMQNAPEVLAVPDDSPIKSVAELKGKTIGLASDRDLVTAQVVLDTAGISIDEVTTAVVGDSGPVMAKAIRDKQIDAIAAAINDMTTIAANGYKTRDLTPPEVKINPANTFSVWTPRIEELRPHLEKFFRVWAMGTAAGKIDREAVAKMSAKSVPEEWATEELGESLLDGAFVTTFPVTEKYGDVQPDVWKKVQGPYLKFKQIEAELDPATFLDGSFIDAANDFDEEELKTALAEWKAANP
jgi:NitT/TauT family transport system substrate-binding protein